MQVCLKARQGGASNWHSLALYRAMNEYRGSRIRRGTGGGGGPGQPDRKNSEFFLSFFFVVLILQFYRGGPMVYLKENYNFQRFQGGGGGQHFPGGGDPTLSNGFQMLISIETYRT